MDKHRTSTFLTAYILVLPVTAFLEPVGSEGKPRAHVGPTPPRARGASRWHERTGHWWGVDMHSRIANEPEADLSPRRKCRADSGTAPPGGAGPGSSR